MDDLAQQLRGLLDSPGELQRLAQTAQGLLGELGGAEGGEQAAGAGDPGAAMQAAGLSALKSLSAAGSGKTALIDALAPFLGEARRNRLRRAASLASAARLAEKLLAGQNGDAP